MVWIEQASWIWISLEVFNEVWVCDVIKLILSGQEMENIKVAKICMYPKS